MRGLIPRVLAAAAAILAALLMVDCAAAARPPLLAGAGVVDVAVPDGAPLAGYGGFPRRAMIPDVLGRFADAFWFRPSVGVHDPIRIRSLVLDGGATRVLWLTADLVGIDPTLVAEVVGRLARAGLEYSAVIVAASHTHSGPGAYARSALFGVIAVDRLSHAVRDSIVGALDRAARLAEAGKGPARVAVGRAEVTGIAESRVQGPLDTDLGVLKVTTAAGRPIALVWNYAIHGTALGRENFQLSGDLMADASRRLEHDIGAPALFVNGAVGDVSPRPRGWPGVAAAGQALAAGARAAWATARPEPSARLEVVTERVMLPLPSASLRNCVADWIPSNVSVGLARSLPSESEVIALAVGATAWVTIPGELETRLGLDVKAAAGPRFRHVFIAGVANDYLGYFVTPAAYRRPSYIACASLYGERGGEIMRDAAIAALRRLGSRRESR